MTVQLVSPSPTCTRNQIGNMYENLFKKLRIKSNNELSFEEKRKLVLLLIDEIIVYSDTISLIHCVSPMMLSKDECPLKVGGVP